MFNSECAGFLIQVAPQVCASERDCPHAFTKALSVPSMNILDRGYNMVVTEPVNLPGE